MKLHQILITENKQIPKTLPGITRQCCTNVRETHSVKGNSYDYHLYSGDELELIIKNNFDKDVITSYNKLKPYAYKADLARACLLYLYGGLYVDLHIFFVASMDKSHFGEYDFCAFRINTPGDNVYGMSIQNGIMFAKSKSIIIEQYIKLIVNNCKKDYYGSSASSPTGPYCLGKAFHISTNEENENKNIIIGDFRKLTEKRMGFVTNDEELVAIRGKASFDDATNTSGIKGIGIDGVNFYCEMWENNNIYEKNVLF